MDGRLIGAYHRIELQAGEPAIARLPERMQHQLSPYAQSPGPAVHRIGGVGDVGAPADVVGMQHIQPQQTFSLTGAAGKGLGQKELVGLLQTEGPVAGKAVPLLHNLVS